MAEKKIGARIVIDGESEFRANLASAKSELNKFQSELKLVTAKFKDNADSLEALKAKQEVYIKLQEQQKNKVHLLTEMQDRVIKKHEDETKLLADLEQKRANLNNALEEAKETYGENSNEVKELTEKLGDVNEQYEAQEKIVQKTGDKVNSYQTSINNANTELEGLNREIEQNQKKMQDAEESANQCADSVDEYSGEVQDATGKTSVFGDVLKAELLSSAIKSGIKAIADGIKTIATAAVETGSSFEASMSQVAATMGITTNEIANGSKEYQILSKAAQDCGKATKYSASQAGEALNYLALAGYDAEKAASTLPRVLNLAAAGGLELGYASDLVTDSMAALGLETSELDNYIDEMAKTSQKSNTSVAQLGEATLVCAGTVSIAGQSLETMNAELGVLANNGIKGAEGGTHLRNVILSLSAPTDKAADAISGMGLRINDSNGNMRDLNDILIDMNAIMSDMTRAQKIRMINTIFNKTDIAAVNALLKGTGKEYDDLIEQINNCSGAAQDMADTLNDNLKGRITILKSALEGLGITAYGLFDDEMKGAVDSATAAVGRLQDEIDNGNLGVSLDKMSRALGEFVTNAIGAAENALPKLIDGFTWILENSEVIAGLIGGVTSAKVAYTVATKAATVAQQLFNITADANPYILLATAIAGVVGAVTLYTKTASAQADKLSAATRVLVDSSQQLNSQSDELIQKSVENRENFEIERQTCIELAEELDELQQKTELTASEQARQAAIVDELNTAIPNLNLSIDEQTGLTNMSTDAILENIDAQMALMEAEAAREDQAEIAKNKYEAEKLLKELQVEQEEATNKLTEAEEKLRQEREQFLGESPETQEEYFRHMEDIAALNAQISETESTIEGLQAAYEEAGIYIADKEAFLKATGNMQELGEAALNTGADISEMSEEAIEAYNKMYSDLSENIQGQMQWFEKFSSEIKLSKEEILENMQSQITGITEWADNIESLADRGINQGLLQYLADMGPQGAGYVAAFVEMTDEELQKANEMFSESMEIPTSTAANIMDSYDKAAQNAGIGYIKGLASKEGDVRNASNTLAETSLIAAMQTLEEHSPSKKTHEIGENFDEGLRLGIENKKERVLAVITQLATNAITKTKVGLPPEEFKEIGRRVAEGLQEGIESGKSGVIATIQELCNATIQTAKSTLDIHSPSKKFAYLGEMSGEVYITGWQETMKNIDAIIADCMPKASIDMKQSGNRGIAEAVISAISLQNDRVAAVCTDMLNVMSRYLPDIANMKVVTDTGVLIGELAPGLDVVFGELTEEKYRGVG